MTKNLDYDKILTRLTIILQRLHEGEVLSVSDLAEDFNVSTKTIQRDFNERLVRFPIEKIGRKWRMMAGHAIDRVRSTEEELILDMLGEIAQGIGSDFGARTKSLFAKIKNIDENPIYSKIAIEDVSELSGMFRRLQECIRERKICTFRYKGKPRRIKPYKIVSFEGYWYLYGEDDEDKKLKTFRLKSMSVLQKSDEPFLVEAAVMEKLKHAINAWFEPDKEPFEVLLLAKDNIGRFLLARPLSDTQRIQEARENGDLIISLQITSQKEILHEIKKWLPSLVPLAPRSLREECKKINEAFLENLQGVRNV